MDTTIAARTTAEHAPEWFDSWFDSLHYGNLYAHRDEAEAGRLVDALINRLRPSPESHVLDLGCGSGRHARHLASYGFDVTGLDLAAGSISSARAYEHERLRFVRGDMRRPFGASSFDYVFNLFTSFGYFEQPEDHLTVVHNIAKALKPGGTLVLDYVNVRHAEAHLRPSETVERDAVRYGISRWADAAHIYKRIAIAERGRHEPLEYVERVAKLSFHDFQMMFALCGMTVEHTFGDYQLDAFDPEASPRLILVARKAVFNASVRARASSECG